MADVETNRGATRAAKASTKGRSATKRADDASLARTDGAASKASSPRSNGAKAVLAKTNGAKASAPKSNGAKSNGAAARSSGASS